jgi:hypothetical protein
VLSIGYESSKETMMSEPDPTDVIPTTSPPRAPITKVGARFRRNGFATGAFPEARSASVRRAWIIWIKLFTKIDAAATTSAMPRTSFSRSSTR